MSFSTNVGDYVITLQHTLDEAANKAKAASRLIAKIQADPTTVVWELTFDVIHTYGAPYNTVTTKVQGTYEKIDAYIEEQRKKHGHIFNSVKPVESDVIYLD